MFTSSLLPPPPSGAKLPYSFSHRTPSFVEQPPYRPFPSTSATNMSGNYGYSNYNYNRPPDPQSRQPPPGAPPPAPQAPQYGHGHQTYAAHGYQNAPPPPYMNYPQYSHSHQPYSQQPPFVNEARRIDYPPYQQGQALPPNQPPRPGAPPQDQYTPTTAPAIYNSWMTERSSPQQTRPFDEEAEKKYAINVFKRFDQDGGGYLDLQEFMDALRALHLAISYHEALDCFGRYDVNEDGRISQDEFVRIYVSEKRNRSYGNQYPQMMPRSHPPPPPMRP